MNVAYNKDCMEYMKSLPDNYFDLCVADPPYGAGFAEGGGCQGWFTKYHQVNGEAANTHTHTHTHRVEQIRTTIR